MKIIIEFDTGNAAFEEFFEDEVSRVLNRAKRRIEDHVADGYGGGPLSDSNGNTIGEVRFSEP